MMDKLALLLFLHFSMNFFRTSTLHLRLAFVLVVLIDWTWWLGAVFALIDGVAAGLDQWVLGNVLLSSRIGDTGAIGIVIDSTWFC